MVHSNPNATPPRPAFIVPLLGIVLLLLILAITKLMAGSLLIPISDIITVLTGGTPAEETWRTIILEFRLPRLITAVVAGAALGVSGLAMQTLFRNPLADPYVLGVSSGSTLGVAIFLMVANIPFAADLLSNVPLLAETSTVFASAIGSASVFMLILVVSGYVRNNMTLLILGMLVGYTASSLVTILMQFSSKENLERFVHWGFGSFGAVGWEPMRFFLPALIIGLILLGFSGKSLNALLLGENYARSMGQNIFVIRLVVICGASLLAGTVTAYCGPIAFMGIAVPHLTRALFRTADHRMLLPLVMLIGACLACLADLIAQLPGFDITLPLNAVSSLIGAPIIITVILRRRTMGGEM